MVAKETDPTAPPLTFAGHAWRLGVCLAISGFLFSQVAADEWNHHRVLFWAEVVGGLVAYPLVLLRRRRPVAVAVTLALLSTFSGLAAGPATLAGVSVATRRRWPELVVVGLVNFAGGAVYSLTAPFEAQQGRDLWMTLLTSAGINAAMIAWGMFIGSRRELVHSLRQRAARMESEQEQRVARARATERTRIAREMHDVLAHRITQVSMQAGALAFREDLDAPRLRAGLIEIQGLSNAALDELRSVLGVLRDDAVAADELPQPTYADVDALVESARSSLVPLDHENLVSPHTPVPDSTGRALYRIAQEAITNARKHAPGETVLLRFTGSPRSGIQVLVRNRTSGTPTAAPGAGLGLVGLRERAELQGGRLTERRHDDWFELEGWLPWES